MSLRALQHTHNVTWRTVQRALDGPQLRKKQRRKGMLVPYSGTLPSASMTAWWRATGLSPSAGPLGDVAVEQIESAGVSELTRRSVPVHG